MPNSLGPISSAQNAKVKQVRQLLDKASYRKKMGLTVLESPKVIAEILAQSPQYFVYGLCREDALFASDKRFLTVTDPVFRSLSEVSSSQGVIAVVAIPNFALSIPTQLEWALVLDGISDPRNLGAILRSAKAFGCPLIVLSPDCADPFHPETLRVAATPIFKLNFSEFTESAWRHLLEDGLTPVSLDVAGEPIHPGSQFPNRPMFIMGSEGSGIRSPWIKSAQNLSKWRIEMSPEIDSLNVSVAAGIVLHMFKYSQNREG